MEVVEYDFFRHFVDLFLLSEDDISLPLDSGFFQFRVLQYIRDDIDCLGHVLSE